MLPKESDSLFMSMTPKNLKNRKNNYLTLSNLSSGSKMMMTLSPFMLAKIRNQTLAKGKSRPNPSRKPYPKNSKKNHENK